MILSVPPFIDFQNLYFPWVLKKSYHRLGKIIYGGKIKHDYGSTKKKKKTKLTALKLSMDLIEWNNLLKTDSNFGETKSCGLGMASHRMSCTLSTIQCMMSYLLKQNAQVQEPKEDVKMASLSKVAEAIFLSLQSSFYGEKDTSFHGEKMLPREHNQGSVKFEIESALWPL